MDWCISRQAVAGVAVIVIRLEGENARRWKKRRTTLNEGERYEGELNRIPVPAARTTFTRETHSPQAPIIYAQMLPDNFGDFLQLY